MNKWNEEFFERFKFEGLAFNDVLLKPQKSSAIPRDVDLTTMLSTNIPLNIPLVSADMDTVTDYRMARAMAMAGGIGFLWRSSAKNQEDWVDRVKYTFNAKIDKPITIREDQTLDDVTKKLAEYDNRFSSLVVVNSDGKVIGLVTDQETRFADKKDKIKDFMVKKPVTSEKDFDISQAYKFMKKRRIGKLILVNPDGTLRGLYCWKDVKDMMEDETSVYNRDERGQLRVGANIGVRDYKRAERLLRKHCDVLLVGTAHGHSKNVIDTARRIKRLKETVGELKRSFSQYEFDIIAGNVATYEGAKELYQAGADAVKVGVGPGSICTTRVISGVGIPQITAIYEASKAAAEFDRPLIADGGIKYSGDVAKAMAARGDSVMIGGLFAGTVESPGEIVHIKGKRYKDYRGMGSLGAMASSRHSKERYKQKGAEKLVPEGVEGVVPLTGPVDDLIFYLLGGLRSGMGYVGAHNIKELQQKGEFIRISSAGVQESHPHDIIVTKEAPNYQTGGGK